MFIIFVKQYSDTFCLSIKKGGSIFNPKTRKINLLNQGITKISYIIQILRLTKLFSSSFLIDAKLDPTRILLHLHAAVSTAVSVSLFSLLKQKQRDFNSTHLSSHFAEMENGELCTWFDKLEFFFTFQKIIPSCLLYDTPNLQARGCRPRDCNQS